MSRTSITFNGHTTILFRAGELRFIFDPNFENKTLMLNRMDKPVFDADEMHQVNSILISNAHHNRLAPSSFKYFKQTAQVMMPLGLGRILSRFYHFHINELKAGAETTIGDCRIIAVKALHRGFRTPDFGYKNALNYLIKAPGFTLFYVSDSRHEGDYFYKIGKEHNIDVVCMPLDHVGPDLIAGKRFLSTREALQAFRDLGASRMIPYGYGSFNFNGRSRDKVEKKLFEEMAKAGLSDEICILKPGETLDWQEGELKNPQVKAGAA